MNNNINDTTNEVADDSTLIQPSKILKPYTIIDHKNILHFLLENIKKADFQKLAFPQAKNGDPVINEEKIEKKINNKQYLILSIEHVLFAAKRFNWDMCTHNEAVYLFNGAYWRSIDRKELESFFGKAAEKMGVPKWDARYYNFRDQLVKQFFAVANLPKPEYTNKIVLINLKNGTFEISSSIQQLRTANKNDFITYQLPFEYNPEAKAPLFQKFLNQVQPDIERQKVLSEYLGCLFIKQTTLKLEKALLLYGTGSNGKSVFFEIVNALLGGNENVSNFSLQNLTNNNGYYRAMISNKLLNYASEINGKLETSVFKQLVSGEPVEARLPYGNPFMITDYAKLIFNCNELPKDIEHTHAYFRRFLIVSFDVTIPENEQDKELSQKIIESELSGLFNWVLDGLKRLLFQKNFTKSIAVAHQLDQYKSQSDSVLIFMEDEEYEVAPNDSILLKVLYVQYQIFCKESGLHHCSLKTFSERLRANKYVIERKTQGNVVYVKKKFNPAAAYLALAT